MPIDSDEVLLAPFGNVYVAPVGTPLPTTSTGALNAAFTAVGYIDENGVSMTPTVDNTGIMMWQSAVEVKTTINTIEFEVSFSMGQVNATTWGLYFFNEEFTEVGGEGHMTVSSNPTSQEKALIIEWEDDLEQQSRLIIPRAFLSNREALQLVRNNAQLTGVTFRVLDSSGTFFHIYSEVPSLNPGS